MKTIEPLRNSLVNLFQQDESWPQLFQHHGWNIDERTLNALTDDQLTSTLLDTALTIDRTLTGFEDFNAAGDRLITPGQPSASLLYHALASPNVVARPDGFEIMHYPQPADIEIVENFIFASAHHTLDSLVAQTRELMGFPPSTPIELFIGVFAIEYRPLSSTVHRTHADLCFSRTGVARVGTKEAHYNPQLRGFSVFTEGDNTFDIHTLPCRFSAYICAKLKGRKERFGPIDSMNEANRDSQNDFYIPLHKLFEGSECLEGSDLSIEWHARHFNQKLEKLAARLRAQGFDEQPDTNLEQPPFRVEENLAQWSHDVAFGTGLLLPVPHPIVAPATTNTRPTGFKVPPMETSDGFSAAFAPTLTLSGQGGARPWPEYAHVREQIDASGETRSLTDAPNVVEITTEGNYNALHYQDFAADGWVSVDITHQKKPLQFNGQKIIEKPAYSLVSAPDFFPKVRQRQVFEWWKNIPEQSDQGHLPEWWSWLVDQGYWQNLWRAEPKPLSDERVAANIDMPDSPFDPADKGVTAIVSLPQETSTHEQAWDPALLKKFPHAQRHTSLPDAAAGVFAPGWDTSFDRSDDGVDYLAAYGLGSPFPEDAKLCAALSTFWPAAAPDTTRTFFNVPYSAGSVAPLTDAEMGVGDGAIAWDDVTGPTITAQNAEHLIVEYPNYPKADYTRSALEGKLSIAQTSRITLEEYKRRIITMLRAYRAIDHLDSKNQAHILSFSTVNSGNDELELAQERGHIELIGPVYRVEGFNDSFNGTDNVSTPEALDAHSKRERRQVRVSWQLFIGSGENALLRWKLGDGSQRRSNWIVKAV